MIHTLKRNLTKLVYVSEGKSPSFKIFISLLFQGKKWWNLKCKFKYDFSIALCEKNGYFSISRKKVFWDVKSSLNCHVSS